VECRRNVSSSRTRLVCKVLWTPIFPSPLPTFSTQHCKPELLYILLCVVFRLVGIFFVALLGRVNKAQQEGGIVKAWGLRVAKSPKSGGNLNDQKQNQNWKEYGAFLAGQQIYVSFVLAITMLSRSRNKFSLSIGAPTSRQYFN